MTIGQMKLWVNPEDNIKMLKDLDEGRVVKGREYLFRSKDGRRVIGRFSANYITVGGEKCIFVTMEDITEEKTIERAKSEFVDVASHQMRTPLSAIKWYAELLEQKWNGLKKEEMKPFVEEIMKSGNRMSDYVDLLLKVAKLEMGNFAVDLVPMKIVSVIQPCLEILRPEIVRKNLEVEEDYKYEGRFFG